MSTTTTNKQLKAQLRREAIARRNALEGRARRSALITTRLEALPAYSAATAIHCFLPIHSEVDTTPFIRAALRAGKAVAVPVLDESGVLTHSWISTLEAGSFSQGHLGTLRPRELRPAWPGAWSLTIVPLLAFDREGYRLGYGKGYYDQLLTQISGAAVGVAFAIQELPAIPREPHDHRLGMIVTEAGQIIPASPAT